MLVKGANCSDEQKNNLCIASLQNKTMDPDWQILGRSGKLSFFIIHKFGKIVLWSGKFQI